MAITSDYERRMKSYYYYLLNALTIGNVRGNRLIEDYVYFDVGLASAPVSVNYRRIQGVVACSMR